jgi:beta-phosphoglucomutase-like phosphatase (HAD superfamily)
MTISSIIFDCDGTLANTMAAHCQSWLSAFEKFSFYVPEAWFHHHCSLPQKEFIARFCSEYNCQIASGLLIQERERFFVEKFSSSITEIKMIADIAR